MFLLAERENLRGTQHCYPVRVSGAGENEPAGLRERKKLATRQAIGVAAMRLAVQRGLESVHVEDIAAEAGVSARTFNNYFASKGEAICALAMERVRQLGAALSARPAGEPLKDAIEAAVLAQYADREQAPDKEWLACFRMVVESPALQGEYLRTQDAAQHALAEAIAERTGSDLTADMFPSVLAGAVMAATNVACARWIHADPPTALGPLVRTALGHVSGLAGAGAAPPANSVANARRAPHADRAAPRCPTPDRSGATPRPPSE